MHGNIFLDANTFDYITHENDLLGQLFALHEANKINIVISGRVRDETIHPNTPREVRVLAEVQNFTLPVQLIGTERSRLNEIKRLMGGNAQSGKHDADAQHIFDASKNGGRYLITHDKRILAKRLELESLLTPFRVVTLDEFSAALKEFGLL